MSLQDRFGLPSLVGLTEDLIAVSCLHAELFKTEAWTFAPVYCPYVPVVRFSLSMVRASEPYILNLWYNGQPR